MRICSIFANDHMIIPMLIFSDIVVNCSSVGWMDGSTNHAAKTGVIIIIMALGKIRVSETGLGMPSERAGEGN